MITLSTSTPTVYGTVGVTKKLTPRTFVVRRGSAAMHIGPMCYYMGGWLQKHNRTSNDVDKQ